MRIMDISWSVWPIFYFISYQFFSFLSIFLFLSFFPSVTFYIWPSNIFIFFFHQTQKITIQISHIIYYCITNFYSSWIINNILITFIVSTASLWYNSFSLLFHFTLFSLKRHIHSHCVLVIVKYTPICTQWRSCFFSPGRL